MRVVGLASLALLFVASAIGTTAYLTQNGRALAGGQAAAAAIATQPIDLDIGATGGFAFDTTTGEVLFAKNPGAQLPLASLAKVVLALAVSDFLAPDTLIAIPPHATPDGAVKRFPDGSTWRSRDLMNFMLVNSSNEGAELIAAASDEAIRKRYPAAPAGGAALYRMNALVRELGLTRTYFLNVSGLDISPTQAGAFGTARETAEIFAYAALNHPDLFVATTKNGMLLTSEEGERATAKNTDKALGEIHGLMMGKTGTTDLAGGNLAVAFDIGPAHPIVAVILHSSDDGRFEDMKRLVAAIEDRIAKR
ncbi:MAG: hypothetical protein RLZZ416_416 [Candidatus Parcubacteria bacterium]|jgi:D-alanyl-D-alanine endopeptidase (penicillin-binding protein 7)